MHQSFRAPHESLGGKEKVKSVFLYLKEKKLKLIVMYCEMTNVSLPKGPFIFHTLLFVYMYSDAIKE